MPPLTAFPVAIHFAHRVVALAVAALIAASASGAPSGADRAGLRRAAAGLCLVAAAQIALGAVTVLSAPGRRVHDRARGRRGPAAGPGRSCSASRPWPRAGRKNNVVPTAARAAEGLRMEVVPASAIAVASTRAEAVAPSRAADLLELTKPRITTLVLVTAAVGYAVGTVGAVRRAALPALPTGTGAPLRRSVGAQPVRGARRRRADEPHLPPPDSGGTPAPRGGAALRRRPLRHGPGRARGRQPRDARCSARPPSCPTCWPTRR